MDAQQVNQASEDTGRKFVVISPDYKKGSMLRGPVVLGVIGFVLLLLIGLAVVFAKSQQKAPPTPKATQKPPKNASDAVIKVTQDVSAQKSSELQSFVQSVVVNAYIKPDNTFYKAVLPQGGTTFQGFWQTPTREGFNVTAQYSTADKLVYRHILAMIPHVTENLNVQTALTQTKKYFTISPKGTFTCKAITLPFPGPEATKAATPSKTSQATSCDAIWDENGGKQGFNVLSPFSAATQIIYCEATSIGSLPSNGSCLPEYKASGT